MPVPLAQSRCLEQSLRNLKAKDDFIASGNDECWLGLQAEKIMVSPFNTYYSVIATEL